LPSFFSPKERKVARRGEYPAPNIERRLHRTKRSERAATANDRSKPTAILQNLHQVSQSGKSSLSVRREDGRPSHWPEKIEPLQSARLNAVARLAGKHPARCGKRPRFQCLAQTLNQTDIIQRPRPRNSPDAPMDARHMNKPTRVSTELTEAKRPKRSSGGVKAGSVRSRSKVAAIKNAVIASELAPAVAIAVLEKSEQAPGDPPAALDVLAAGASASEIAGNVRVQLMFDNGTVLPVEMSAAAGAALSTGLASELPAVKKPKPRK
jgi:hypothetical protein